MCFVASLQAAAKVQQACAQLQQRLADYEQQPTAGLAHIGAQLSMQSGREMVQVQQQAAGWDWQQAAGVHTAAPQATYAS